MKKQQTLLLMAIGLALSVAMPSAFSQTTTPATPNIAATVPTGAPGETPPAPPPSTAAKLSPAELDKLVAPIALYPDPLVATILPASAYPLEIVQAARLMKNPSNAAKLDQEPWDASVKDVARIPKVLDQLNDNINWTSALGDAFVKEPKEVMEAIQKLRLQAQKSGALHSTPQQTVNVRQQAGAQVVQIQPAQPDVVYVPQYNPTVVFAGMPVAYPGYYYPPAALYPGAAAALSFGAGVAVGAWGANSCDWGGGSVNINNNYNRNFNAANINNRNLNNANVSRWQADNNRLNASGVNLNTAADRESRGWGESGSSWSQAVDRANAQARTENRTLEAEHPTQFAQGRPFSEAAGANREFANAGDFRTSGAERSAFSSDTGLADREASFRGAQSRGLFGGRFRGGGGGAFAGGFHGGGGFGGFHGGGGFGGFHGGGRR